MAVVRVAHIVTSGGIGGAQRHISLLAPRLRPEFECEVASGPGEWLPKQLKRDGVKHQLVPGLRNAFGPPDVRVFLGLCDWLRDGQFALVHTHSSKAGLLGRMAARIVGLPAMFTAHGWAFGDPGWPEWKRFAWTAVERVLAGSCELIITVSDRDAALAKENRIEGHLSNRLIWNAIDANVWTHGPKQEARRRLGISEDLFLVGTVTRLVPEKDHVTLLRAATLVPGVHLLIVGDGPLRRQAEDLASALGLGGRVHWLGDHEDVQTCLRALDVFTLSSSKEGTPYALLEALACGCFPVVTAVGGMATLVGDAGVVVPPGQPGALAEGWLAARSSVHSRRPFLPSLEEQVVAVRRAYWEVLGQTRG